MSKGLTLARTFHLAGHRVIGADFSPLACGRFSAALSAFYTLQKPTQSDSGPYISSLLETIRREGVDLWVSCSGVASAVEDGFAKEAVESQTICKAVQFGIEDTRRLHEKDTFIQHTRSIGLEVPETHTVRSRDSMLTALKKSIGLAAEKGKNRRRFIAKSIGMDDKSRGDMTLLPCPAENETKAHIARLDISDKDPWILQEYVKGEEYCTHALVIRGQVKAFVACPSAELLMHYSALPADSPLSLAMLSFTQRHADAGGPEFTGHLSFDFLVKEEDIKNGNAKDILLYPIECNPRAHTAVVLFNRPKDLADQYLSLLSSDEHCIATGRQEKSCSIIAPHQSENYYWVGHDLVELVLLPAVKTISGRLPLDVTLRSWKTFFEHLVYWRDGTYEFWDPLPWWCLYHVFWPTQFVASISIGQKWSRMNVSTTKMFSSA
ncbi:uncharacterized protein K452DRAFT_270787 [Aplosporella prunicola CBS 121167]|uniref:ATP-grasp domain-containing protein n=1 Tax=Aplosporella prunicola CBS 121167 TaxID=1176127 RepID=A0A6A6BCX7_9PEZI|nr:uncharacterized protein K452DRAFT_270787 [Aplosporella prunicola CBS 121167]KAF2142062.1 hypothetical protein K452DRAFT_270787 [Aplosporella prunicola CBS 121167]